MDMSIAIMEPGGDQRKKSFIRTHWPKYKRETFVNRPPGYKVKIPRILRRAIPLQYRFAVRV